MGVAEEQGKTLLGAVLIALCIAACSPTPVSSGFAAQRAALVQLAPAAEPTPSSAWQTAIASAVTARAAACPQVPAGCFASAPTCEPHICACPRVCAPGKRASGPYWAPTPEGCACA